MSERDDRNVVDMRCYPVNESVPERFTAHSWWWFASGILLASFMLPDPQLTQAAQVVCGAVVILPAAMSLLRRWNPKAEGTKA